jgi:hypothetical protein
MKKIVASVGLVALGASGLQAVSPPGEAGRPWSLSATLRGFYDDNLNTTPSDKVQAWGVEVSPALVISYPWEQTTLDFAYIYSFKDYDHRPAGNTANYDQTHTLSASLLHSFNERSQLSVKDSFVIGQEPDILRAGNTFDTFQRISGDNQRNYGAINYDGRFSRQLGYEIGYANTYYNYDNQGPIIDPFGNVTPSYSGLLDRLEHVIHLDARWQVKPQTVAVVGYQFREMDYTGDEIIGLDDSGNFMMSDVRNSRSHYGYVGVDHVFRPDLSGSLRAGARYSDYFNNPFDQNGVSPYALASMKYTYAPQSSFEAGITYDQTATDLFSAAPGSITVDAQTFSLYGALNHRITRKLFGSINGQYQNTTYNGGQLNNQTDQFFLVGLNLTYRFNPHFSTEIGYNYDNLNSAVSQSFDRNRVYLGLTATY